MFKGLPSYAKWVAQNMHKWPTLPDMYSVDMIGGSATGSLLHREGQFQTEQFYILPSSHGSSFPEHSHPNVDSIEYVLFGHIAFTIGGKRVTTDAELDAGQHIGRMLPVRAKRPHGGSVGAGGAAFVSIQQWRNGVIPSSVLRDWDGPKHLRISNV